MAALPSVVIGFIAGLWLASRVEAALVPVLLFILVLPLFGTAGVLFWERLPHSLLKRLRPGTEVFVIVPLLVLGALVALGIGPLVERLAFAGDLKGYLASSLGLVYDQRNSLVVGLAMGFAVVPIIFTISEDAFSSVPQHLDRRLARSRRQSVADGDPGGASRPRAPEFSRPPWWDSAARWERR